jgi:hypothetical protein
VVARVCAVIARGPIFLVFFLFSQALPGHPPTRYLLCMTRIRHIDNH